jgi:hypothetical protein
LNQTKPQLGEKPLTVIEHMNIKHVLGFPGLFREELGKEGNRFRIVISHGKKKTQEYFFFGAKKSEAEALASAIERWKEIRKSFPVITRVAFAQIERRKSRSGVVGVTRVTKKFKGFEYDFWRATWTDRRGVRRARVFSVNKYGEADARKEAEAARQKGLDDLRD